ncbi:MAG TPA: ABC transporter permease [Puia sp.]|nr:ABC transporter permease [Puia sp.]
MLKNYIKTAWRSLFKSKFYSFINLTGLTIGLAVGILILLWVQSERSFDSFHHNAENIYQVNSPLGSGTGRHVWNTTQAPVATSALKEVPGVKSAVRIYPKYSSVFSYKTQLLKEDNNAYVDPSFFRMFDFTLLKGNVTDPFPNDQSVILTASAAKRYFANEDPVGKFIQEDHKDNYRVSGIIADFPDNSSIHYDMLFPMDLVAKQYDGKDFWKSMDSDWGNFGYTTFLEIQPGVSPTNIGQQLLRIQIQNAPHIKVSLKDNAFQLQPLKQVHLVDADGTPTGLQTVRIFSIIAALILLIACINYINLSTARSMLRAKEVSIRKIVGAAKTQLFAQFIIESFLFFSISLVLAFVLIAVLLPGYNQLAGKHLVLNWLDGNIWRVVAWTMTAVLLASAIYPALLLSSFEPLKALKGKLLSGIANSTFRKVLVTVQFVFSVTLIIGTVVIGKQLTFIREKDPGYDRSQVFSFRIVNRNGSLDAIKARLSNEAGIEAVTSSDSRLENNLHTTAGVSWEGKDANSPFIIHTMGIDEKFLPVLKMKLTEGTNFTGSKADSTHFMLNETAVRIIGLKDPVGKRFKFQETEGTIIGVLKDFHYVSLKEKIQPAVIYFEPAGHYLYVKTTGRNAAKAIAACNRMWNSFYPGFPFEFTFLDEAYGKLYASDQRTGILLTIFSIIAILISCLGLLGLATYTAQIMRKEIGIRKVLGASIPGIITLLSKDFLKLVFLAILIASPLAWIAMHQWLLNFAYRIDLSAGIFIGAGAAAILIALFTISFQSIRAALANPVKSLRTD